MEYISRSIALIIIILLFPLIILLMVICFFSQGWPIFFQQERVGYMFEPFNIIKFRTMVENIGGKITEIKDKRITSFGKILRASKLDEIPQLLNIVKGDMRFIGPRPEVFDYFDEESFSFLKIIKPGISDFSSILLRNEDKILARIGGENPYLELLPIKLDLAKYYSKNKTFQLDLFLVFVTIISIFSPNLANVILRRIFNKEDLKNVSVFLKSYVYQSKQYQV